jgi:hypothetical protein
MGTWWRLRQWVYARPPVMGVLVVVLLSVVGTSGWASARLVTDDVGQKTAFVVKRVTLAKTVRVGQTAGSAGSRSPTPTQLVEASHRAQTVVVTERVPRVLSVVRTVSRVVTTGGTPSTVTHVRTRTVFDTRTITRLAAQTATVTRFETQPAETVVRTVTTPSGHASTNGRETQTVTVTVATATVTVTVTKGH